MPSAVLTLIARRYTKCGGIFPHQTPWGIPRSLPRHNPVRREGRTWTSPFSIVHWLNDSAPQVSMKIFRPMKEVADFLADAATDAARRDEAITRLLKDAPGGSSFQHARINPILGYTFVDGAPCIVNPWCSQGNIRQYLERNPWADRWRIVDISVLPLP
jgi:hypothetical protein